MNQKYHNYFGYSLAIIAIILSFLFWLDGRKKKEVSYQFLPVTKIFDGQNTTSKIRVYLWDSIPYEDDIYLLNGYVWNSGELAITKEDIRKNISVKLSNNVTIIDYKISNQIERGVSKFELTKINDEEIKITHRYFDPGNGLAFQILYVGDLKSEPQILGNIYGVSSFIKSLEKKDMSLIELIILSIGGIIVGASFAIKKDRKNLYYVLSFLSFGISVMIMILYTWELIKPTSSNPFL